MDDVLYGGSESSIGIPELDLQHERLFRLVHELKRAVASGQGHAITGTILNKLVNYTIHHFATEEELMQQHGFPGVAAHRIVHNTLTLKLSELHQQYQSGDQSTAEDCLRFLRTWLEEHVLNADRQFAQYLSTTTENAERLPHSSRSLDM
ncbi:MAG: bacteriohemerythrin [Terriglobales bacterium]